MEQIKTDSILDSVHYVMVEGTDTVTVDSLKVITDTGDTAVIIREVIHDIDLQIIEKLIADEDYGGKIVSILILLFGLIAVLKRWKKNK